MFIPSVNSEYYKDILEHLRNNVRRKARNGPRVSSVITTTERSCDTSHLIREFLAEKRNPTYSPNLAPSYFCVFLEIKTVQKGKRFDTIHDIDRVTIEQLKAVRKETLLLIVQTATHTFDLALSWPIFTQKY